MSGFFWQLVQAAQQVGQWALANPNQALRVMHASNLVAKEVHRRYQNLSPESRQKVDAVIRWAIEKAIKVGINAVVADLSDAILGSGGDSIVVDFAKRVVERGVEIGVDRAIEEARQTPEGEAFLGTPSADNPATGVPHALVELLEQVRNDYLEQLLAVVNEKAAEGGSRVICEPALRQDDNTLRIEGALQLPVRMDMAVLQGDEVTDLFNVESESIINLDAVEFDWSKQLHVKMGPFNWEVASITLPGDMAYDWAPLHAWFWKWFLEVKEDAEPPVLLGAVHFLSDPVVQEESVIEFFARPGLKLRSPLSRTCSTLLAAFGRGAVRDRRK